MHVENGLLFAAIVLIAGSLYRALGLGTVAGGLDGEGRGFALGAVLAFALALASAEAGVAALAYVAALALVGSERHVLVALR